MTNTAAPSLSPLIHLVDDDAAVLKALTRLVRSAGLIPAAFGSPDEFLAHIGPADSGCIVLDLAMPGLPGDELARQALARKPHLPVLLLSGFIEPAKFEQLRQIGVREILGKPPATEELGFALHRCLQR